MTAVAPLKLALHLTTASLILAGLVWLAAGLRAGIGETGPGRLRGTALAIMALVLVQIFLGGLVAGSKAGLVYNTWPTMDGMLLPPASDLFAGSPWIENFVDNLALVQLNHRLTAYLLLGVALLHAVDARRTDPGSGTARRATGVACLVVVQACLGIATLLLGVPLWAALAHQVFAMVVLTMATVHARSGEAAGAAPRLDGATTPFGFEALAKRTA